MNESIEFSLDDHAYVPDEGHLLWPTWQESPVLRRLEMNHAYEARCVLRDGGITRFDGIAQVKRKSAHKDNEATTLVVLLPGGDLGSVSRDATLSLQFLHPV